ncbi:MAG: hypothetical protein ACRDSG_07125, partial [Pseudonocardiaceae bacterium]
DQSSAAPTTRCRSRHVRVSHDEDGFRRLMNEQRSRAKQDSRAKKTGHVDVSAYRQILDTAGSSVFRGYEELSTDARCAASW